MGSDQEEQREERRGPRVVDKRVSARSHDPAPAPSPEPPEAPPPPPSQPSEPQPEPPGPPGEQAHVWTPEEEEMARRMAEEMVRIPGRDWIINVCSTLINVAAAKLDAGNAADARTVIDTLRAIVDGVGTDLGDVLGPLKQTVAELQLVYAGRVQEQPPGAPPT